MLGKTLYEMITGSIPYTINYGNIPSGFQMVIRKATQENHEDRYQNVGSLLDAFLDSYRAMIEVDINGFKTLVEIATEKLNRGEAIDDISTIVENVVKQEDYEELIEFFHEISDEVLREIVADNNEIFLPLIKKYQYAIEMVLGGYTFSFAEEIEKRMIIIIDNTTSVEIKSKALTIILIAAVKLNRFSVMDSFNNVLTSITEDIFAEYVAEELRSNISFYEKIFNQVPRKELHKFIAVVWDRCN